MPFFKLTAVIEAEDRDDLDDVYNSNILELEDFDVTECDEDGNELGEESDIVVTGGQLGVLAE